MLAVRHRLHHLGDDLRQKRDALEPQRAEDVRERLDYHRVVGREARVAQHSHQRRDRHGGVEVLRARLYGQEVPGSSRQLICGQHLDFETFWMIFACASFGGRNILEIIIVGVRPLFEPTGSPR